MTGGIFLIQDGGDLVQMNEQAYDSLGGEGCSETDLEKR